MNISHYRDRGRYMDHIALFHQQLFCLCTYCFNECNEVGRSRVSQRRNYELTLDGKSKQNSFIVPRKCNQDPDRETRDLIGTTRSLSEKRQTGREKALSTGVRNHHWTGGRNCTGCDVLSGSGMALYQNCPAGQLQNTSIFGIFHLSLSCNAVPVLCAYKVLSARQSLLVFSNSLSSPNLLFGRQQTTDLLPLHLFTLLSSAFVLSPSSG